MGKRDFRHHETKKPKKGSQKLPATGVVTTPPTVEVIKKHRKEEVESGGGESS